MDKHNQYMPETISHPGKTLKAKIEEMDLSVAEFSLRADQPEASVMAIINGDSPVTEDMAVSFENATNIPARFWMSRQHNYDEFKAKSQRRISPVSTRRIGIAPSTRSRIPSHANPIARQ